MGAASPSSFGRGRHPAPQLLLLLVLALAASSSTSGAAPKQPLILTLKKMANVNQPTTTSGGLHRRSDLTGFSLPAGTHGLGLYYITMALGTPPQSYNGIIDTGSGLIHVPCGSPAGVTPVPTFNYAASSSHSAPLSCQAGSTQISGTQCGPMCSCPVGVNSCFTAAACSCGSVTSFASAQQQANNNCMYKIAYGDGSSATGYLFTDTAYFDGNTGTTATLSVGCATDFTKGMFDTVAPYFIGINWQRGSLVSQLTAAGVTDDTFGVCIGDGAGDQVSHGLLVLGSATLSTPATILTTTLPTGSSDLTLALGSITVGSTTLSNAGVTYSALLDTGTSLCLFPTPLATQLSAALKTSIAAAIAGTSTKLSTPSTAAGLLGVILTFATAVTPGQLDALLPSMSIQLGPSTQRVTITLPPSRYLIPDTNRAQDITWGFVFNSGDGTQAILGNELIRNWWIQATKSSLQVNIALVNDCNSLAFSTPLSTGTLNGSPSGSTTGGTTPNGARSDFRMIGVSALIGAASSYGAYVMAQLGFLGL